MDVKNRTVEPVADVEGNAGLEFRITILNFTLYVAAIFALLFALLHQLQINDLGPVHSIVAYLYSFSSFAFIILLRRSRKWFDVIAPLFVGLSIICFTSALIFVSGDEFRLIWFYFVIYVTYVLLSDRAGLIATALCILIVLACELLFNLQLSHTALLTGILGMFIISILSRTYTMQIVRYESQLGEKNRKLQQSIGDLDQALETAREASRAKSLFLANMSHEIRTPMNGVLGMVQVMRGTSLDKDQEHYLDTIQRAGKNLLVLIDDLLDISRIESGKLELDPKPFSTFDWTMDVQFVTEPLFEQGEVAYTTELSDQLPKWLLGDSARLTQIVTNLVSNAAKFTHRGEVRLLVGGEAAGDDKFNLLVEVSDTGIGIPADKLEHIFAPFEQVNPERITNKGVGLGLAICKRLAQVMGGDLTAESAAGVGSRFRLQLSLPVVSGARRAAKETVTHVIDRPLRVLLVDDDAINRLAVKTLLAQQGHQVAEAEHGEDAIGLLQQKPYDLVLMDVHMPVMDGVTATGMIRANGDPQLAKIPIIGLTASVMNEERQHYLEVGMNAVVQKPIVLEQLIATIQANIRPASR